MREFPRLLAAAALFGVTLTATPGFAQSACYQVRCASVPASQAVTPSIAPAWSLPPSHVGRAAADMHEEGAAWQSANAPAEQATASTGTGVSRHARPARPARHRATAATTRRASARSHVSRRSSTTRTRTVQASRHVSRTAVQQDFNPVVDRAGIYRSTASGASTHLSQWSGRGETWQSGTVTTWTGPAQWSWQVAPMAGPQGPVMASQMCGWGQQSQSGLAAQPAFLCHCPAGWRPPGWQSQH
jgi:hypothetical protein